VCEKILLFVATSRYAGGLKHTPQHTAHRTQPTELFSLHTYDLAKSAGKQKVPASDLRFHYGCACLCLPLWLPEESRIPRGCMRNMEEGKRIRERGYREVVLWLWLIIQRHEKKLCWS
jgi:hypothetical protein